MLLRTQLLFACCLAAAIGCNRSASAPDPIPPAQPLAPRAPSSDPTPAAAPETAPPKEGAPDAPQSATAAPPPTAQEEKPTSPAEPAKPSAKKRTRQIHRSEGNTGCVEMYGTCTPPPDPVCTSSALYVDCGQRAQVPSSGEWVHCLCE